MSEEKPSQDVSHFIIIFNVHHLWCIDFMLPLPARSFSCISWSISNSVISEGLYLFESVAYMAAWGR